MPPAEPPSSVPSLTPFLPDAWATFRDLRLHALATDPGAFSSNLVREAAYPEGRWRAWLADPECCVFAVNEGEDLIGMTGVYVDGARPAVAALWGSWLAPAHRGRGYAAALYDARLAWARAHPTVREVHVSHRASNTRSMRANQRHGFRFTHEAARDWPDGTREPERCYTLDLGKPPSAVTRIWRARDRRAVPWKNGRGTTTEIGVSPEGASLEGFDWRLSMAPIVEDGPFSTFPGIDRTLVLLEGADLALDIPPEVVRLRAAGDLARFPGEAAVTAHLGAGPVTDINVMVRRARFSHDAAVVWVTGATDLGTGAPLLVVAMSGAVRAGGVPLGPGEAVVAEGALHGDGDGTVLVGRLHVRRLR